MKENNPVHKNDPTGQWWATEAEKDFLSRIGTFAKDTYYVDGPEPPDDKRLRLLVNYRDAMALRKHWGRINPEEVLEHVNRCLQVAAKRIKEYENGRSEKEEEEYDRPKSSGTGREANPSTGTGKQRAGAGGAGHSATGPGYSPN